jgi:hypothetical protein
MFVHSHYTIKPKKQIVMNNKITIEQAVKQINEGFSSIYSKDDVLNLLSVIETETSNNQFEITDEMVRELSSNIAEAIESEGTDIVDDYELSMNCKEVELDSIDLNEGRIRAAVKDALEAYIEINKADAE